MAFGLRQTSKKAPLRFRLPAGEKRDLPLALWFLAIAGLIFGLQLVPVLNTILLFLLIPFLPILLINLCMIGIVAETLAGQVAKGWLVVPLFYVLAYLALATISHVDMARLESTIRQHNANQLIDFTATNDLLLRNDGGDGTVNRLLEDHDLSVIYEETSNSQGPRILSHRLAVGPECDRGLRKAYRAGDPVISGIFERDKWSGRRLRSTLVKDMCVIRQASSVPADAVKVEIKQAALDDSNFFLYTKRGSIRIMGKDGKTANLIFVETYPLSWIPMPYFMCARGPGDAKDHCFGGFLRFIPTVLGGEDGRPAALIATSLGIMKASASSRRDAIRVTQGIPNVLP